MTYKKRPGYTRGTLIQWDGETFKSKLEMKYWELLKQTGAIVSYESVQLEGWHPDFEIETAQGEVLLAEVKGTSNEGALEAKTVFDIINNKVKQTVLILSGNPQYQRWQRDQDTGAKYPELHCGYVYLPSDGESSEAGECFPLVLVRTRKGSWDFVHRGAFNTGLLTGEAVGYTYMREDQYLDFQDVMGNINRTVNKAARES